jgi:hypothetical protein
MPISYLVSPLSENIGRTAPVMRDGREVPGYLVAKDQKIARTGWQRYSVKDLPQGRAKELGIDLSNPYAFIDLYRPAEQVFDPDFMASLEGMPITDTHPPDFVAPDNWREYAQGHIQNIRKGKESLDSGDWPLVADLIINVDPLMRDVELDRKREVSLGYMFDIAKEGQKIIQCDMRGNHMAIVPNGRAGHEVRITDSAPALDEATLRQVEAGEWAEFVPEKLPDAEASAVTVRETKNKKENATMKTNWVSRLLGMGFKQLAMDAETKPEDLTEAAKAMAAKDEETEEEKAEKEKRMAADKLAADKRATDEAEAEKKRKDEEEKKAEDARRPKHNTRGGWNHTDSATDSECKPGEAGHKDCTADKCMAKDRGARDADGGDHRSRMHAALDNMLDKHEKENGPLEGEDADMEELKELMGKFLSEEAQEPEHSEDGQEPIEPVGEMPEEEMMVANDAAAELLPVIEKSKEKAVLMQAFDAAPDDEYGFLKAIKPAIARSKDKAVRKAFDSALRKYTRTSRPANGGYGEFASAAAANDAARIAEAGRQQSPSKVQDCTKINEMYRNARNGKPLLTK